MCVTIRQEEIINERTVNDDLIDIIEADNGLSVNCDGIERFVLFYFNGFPLNDAEALRLTFENDDASGFHCSDIILLNATLVRLQQLLPTDSW